MSSSRQQGAESDEYSAFLRERLGNTLSNAVAEVINERPRDPIEHLAKLLYRSRNVAPPSEREYPIRERRERMMNWSSSERLRPPSVSRTRTSALGSVVNPLTRTIPEVRNENSRKADIQKKPPHCSVALVKTKKNKEVTFCEEDECYEEEESGHSMSFGQVQYVHRECVPLFINIGDIFDDYDFG